MGIGSENFETPKIDVDLYFDQIESIWLFVAHETKTRLKLLMPIGDRFVKSDRDIVWVVSDAANNIFGFGHLQVRVDSAELMGLYFVPEAIGQGFGKQMISLMPDERSPDWW
jgi:hypothetical protein